MENKITLSVCPWTGRYIAPEGAEVPSRVLRLNFFRSGGVPASNLGYVVDTSGITFPNFRKDLSLIVHGRPMDIWELIRERKFSNQDFGIVISTVPAVRYGDISTAKGGGCIDTQFGKLCRKAHGEGLIEETLNGVPLTVANFPPFGGGVCVERLHNSPRVDAAMRLLLAAKKLVAHSGSFKELAAAVKIAEASGI
jgi:hypothetical protein